VVLLVIFASLALLVAGVPQGPSVGCVPSETDSRVLEQGRFSNAPAVRRSQIGDASDLDPAREDAVRPTGGSWQAFPVTLGWDGEESPHVAFFPNPVREYVRFIARQICWCRVGGIRVKIYDMSGRLLWEGRSDQPMIECDVSNAIEEPQRKRRRCPSVV